MEYATTIGEDDRVEILKEAHPRKDPAFLTDVEKDKLIPDAYFERDDHMLEVVDRIINRSVQKFGLDRQEGPYSAILTTSSIKKAQRYYELFQEVIAGRNPRVTISKKVQRLVADFPKVAITYSLAGSDAKGEEEEGTANESLAANKEKMLAALEDYNALYGT